MKISRRELLKKSMLSGLGAVSLPLTGFLRPSISMEKSIITKPIPSTGELLPVIGMGTWQTFDLGPSDANRASAKEVLKSFVGLGGKLIDSSPMYGNSEGVVGDLATELSVQKSLFMATKVWTSGETAGQAQMEESMKLLRCKPIDLMQVHNLLDYKTHYQTLRKWKEEGKIRYIGITHYTSGAHASLTAILKKDPVDFVQVNYSLETREAEEYLLPLAIEKKVAVIINRPFESGAIFSKVKGKPLPRWASGFDCESWGQFFLKFIVSHPAVTCAIPATSRVIHLKDNMGACYGRLPDENTRREMIKYMASI
jgi:diketogulonate reductase-like aldo/keto reductase